MGQKFTVPVSIKQLGSAGSEAFTIYVDADSYARLKVDAGGKLTWGSGSATGDTTLYRSAADTLKTDDSFEATGSVTATGKVSTGSYLESTASSGDEGGEIQLAKPATNSSISGNVVVDIYQNKLRFFESTGTNRGAYIDLTAASTGVGSNLLTGGGGGATTLDGLTDVTAPSPTSGDFLKYNGSAWVNDPINLGTDTTGNYMTDVSAGTGISVTHTPGEGSTATIGLNASLDNLSDVVITSPEEFQGLSYNGTSWVNGFIPLVSYVRNAEATTITTGTCVYLFGATGDHATVKRADNGSDTTSSKTIGVVGANIAASQNGPIITRGYVDGIDLSVGYTAGDILWLGENGAFTTTKPTSPDHLVFIGVVVRATNNGIIYVATQNGYELDELHNVSLPSPVANDLLAYDGSLWVATNSPTVTSLTVNGASIVFEGATADAFETTLTVTDPTVDRTITLPDVSGTVVTTGDTGSVTSTMIADSTIVNADINASAAIALSKLASGTSAQIVLANGSGVPTYTTVSGDVTISNTGATTIGSSKVTSDMIVDGTIVNGDISTSAAIAHSKLANATAGQVLLGTTTTGVITATTISGDITIDGAGVATIAANSVALGTDTTGNYMSGVSAGTGVTVTHTPGEGSTATIAIGQAVGTADSPSFAAITASTGNITATLGNLVGSNLVVTNSIAGAYYFAALGNDSITYDDANDIFQFNSDGGTANGTLGCSSIKFANNDTITYDDTGNIFSFNSDGSTGNGGIDCGDVTASAITSADKFLRDGNISAASWTTAGVAFQSAASTFTDTSAGGTVATAVANSFNRPTFAASNARTITSAATVYIANSPLAGTNVTQTNTYALWVDAGVTRLDGDIDYGGSIYNTSTSNYIEIGSDQSTGIGQNTTTDIGVRLSGSGAIWASRNNGTLLVLNRMQHTAGGTLAEFRTNGAAKGTITENAGTVSYNAFLGSHYTEIDGTPPLRGTVMESTGVLVDGWLSDQSRLPKCKVSDTVGSTAVFGIYFGEHIEDETVNGHLVASIGAAWVRMASGSTPSLGDLIESNGDGCARIQEDTIIRSSTIGKLSSTTPAEVYEDGSYLLPCVLYCG